MARLYSGARLPIDAVQPTGHRAVASQRRGGPIGRRNAQPDLPPMWSITAMAKPANTTSSPDPHRPSFRPTRRVLFGGLAGGLAASTTARAAAGPHPDAELLRL